MPAGLTPASRSPAAMAWMMSAGLSNDFSTMLTPACSKCPWVGDEQRGADPGAVVAEPNLPALLSEGGARHHGERDHQRNCGFHRSSLSWQSWATPPTRIWFTFAMCDPPFRGGAPERQPAVRRGAGLRRRRGSRRGRERDAQRSRLDGACRDENPLRIVEARFPGRDRGRHDVCERRALRHVRRRDAAARAAAHRVRYSLGSEPSLPAPRAAGGGQADRGLPRHPAARSMPVEILFGAVLEEEARVPFEAYAERGSK